VTAVEGELVGGDRRRRCGQSLQSKESKAPERSHWVLGGQILGSNLEIGEGGERGVARYKGNCQVVPFSRVGGKKDPVVCLFSQSSSRRIKGGRRSDKCQASEADEKRKNPHPKGKKKKIAANAIA